MEVTLEGRNSAETFPPRDGVARLHRPVTGKLAVWLDNYYSLLFAFFFIFFKKKSAYQGCSFPSPFNQAVNESSSVKTRVFFLFHRVRVTSMLWFAF
ncbi:hypothetical protein BO94DRAFT_119776 [Aspergillus sclerotioniger CBS 115572]|uniref:Uncharacterized protein n=1 Tax=Aspergillus sclerotioniger CBS 115572 TaxID=1450535 RepID=A0A317WG41_9EURO|nr:hypothetical protein BO94DRAFT_119776 [Aspergillus sclerotioniger CBS 115572]PWY83150.1 hypothetical protein BO94DRAFT_119776 [Aspergillus sclerotioniger CBS 115572]